MHRHHEKAEPHVSLLESARSGLLAVMRRRDDGIAMPDGSSSGALD
jgi:hypothetical protein